MFEKYINLNRTLRSLTLSVYELNDLTNYPFTNDDSDIGIITLSAVVSRQFEDLKQNWPKEIGVEEIDKCIDDLCSEDKQSACYNILSTYLPKLGQKLDDYYLTKPNNDINYEILTLLHSHIISSSYAQFRVGQYRDAVFNSVVAIFELIRNKTGLDKDGSNLIDGAFSLGDPYLVISTLDTESGQNEQKGFIQILKGYYQGVRNPKAHSLNIEIDQISAAQYLVTSSMLCRKVEDAKLINKVED